MIKVLMIESSLGIGGQEKMSIELSMLNSGEVVTEFLVAGDDTGPYRGFLERHGFVIHHVPSPREGYLSYYKNLKTCVEQNGPYDILYSNGVLNNGLNALYGHMLGIPKRISHCHSSTSGRGNDVLSGVYERTMKYLVRRYSTHYLSCGELAGAYLYGKTLFAKSGIVIPNGIDSKRFLFDPKIREDYRNQLGIESTAKVYGTVARFSQAKNHLRLLCIFREVLNRNPNAVLLLVGDGELRLDVEQAAKDMGMYDKVLILGNRLDVPYLLATMDCFVLPSQYEGVPVSLIEAQASGLRCIVSDTISKEVDITGSICYFSLKQSDKELALLFEQQESCDRIDANKIVSSSRYNIEKSRELLLHIYTL